MANQCKMWVLQLMLLGYISYVSSVTMESAEFLVSTHCLNPACIKEDIGPARSDADCASPCGRDPKCVGFQVEQGKNCVLFRLGCFLNSSCSHNDPSVHVFQKKSNASSHCENTGVWDDGSQACQCSDGFVGDRCERYPYNCEDLHAFQYPPGDYRVIVDVYKNHSLLPETLCSISSASAQTYIFRSHGLFHHNKTWQEYVDGYKIGDSDVWLGLENILAFSRMGHRDVVFLVKMISAQTRESTYRNTYRDFVMQDSGSGYKFTCGLIKHGPPAQKFLPPSQELADVLLPCNNRSFLTFDKDPSRGQCAHRTGAGWWYPDCDPTVNVNPLGILKHYDSSLPTDRFLRLSGFNTDDPQFQSSFKEVAMLFFSEFSTNG